MTKNSQNSNQRIVFPICLFAEDEIVMPSNFTDEIHVVPTGKWDHPMYGEMEITPTKIAEFVQNFRDKVRRDIPITAGHDNGHNGGELPAVGWFKELIDRGVNGLYAIVEWTEEGKELLSKKAFKYFSPEFYETYKDPETGKSYNNVLVGGALTNKPYFKELEPVVMFSEPSITNQFNHKISTMDLKTIVAKKVDELSAEEKAFLIEHKAELSADEAKTFESVVGAVAPVEEPKKEEPAPVEAPVEPTPEPTPAPVTASEGKFIQMSELEVNVLREAAERGKVALDKLNESEIKSEVALLTFSESNKDGKFHSNQTDSVVGFVKTLSASQRKQFKEIIAAMPKTNIFSEVGTSTDNSVIPTGVKEISDRVKVLASEMQAASKKKMSYAEAVRTVLSQNPELADMYSKAK